MTKHDGEYIVHMAALAEKGILDENRICSDCDEEFYQGEAALAARDHGVMKLDDASWSLIIGCLGYHEMTNEGRAKEK